MGLYVQTTAGSPARKLFRAAGIRLLLDEVLTAPHTDLMCDKDDVRVLVTDAWVAVGYSEQEVRALMSTDLKQFWYVVPKLYVAHMCPEWDTYVVD